MEEERKSRRRLLRKAREDVVLVLVGVGTCRLGGCGLRRYYQIDLISLAEDGKYAPSLPPWRDHPVV